MSKLVIMITPLGVVVLLSSSMPTTTACVLLVVASITKELVVVEAEEGALLCWAKLVDYLKEGYFEGILVQLAAAAAPPRSWADDADS
jgi:hypothetical protein